MANRINDDIIMKLGRSEIINNIQFYRFRIYFKFYNGLKEFRRRELLERLI